MVSNLMKVSWCRRLAQTGDGEVLRRQAGLSVGDLAAAIGVHPATLRRWETGATTPNSAAALHWFDALHEIAVASDESML